MSFRDELGDVKARLLLLAKARLSKMAGAYDRLEREVNWRLSPEADVWDRRLVAVAVGVMTGQQIQRMVRGVEAYDEELLRLIDTWAARYPGLGVTPLTPPPAALTHAEVAPEDNTRSLLDGAGPARVAAIPAARACAPSPAARKRPTRDDAMSVELGLLVDQMCALDEKVAAATVMHRLRALAGSKGSCIEEEILEGVLWRRDNGQQEKLTIRNLESRLRRRKQR
jgi:hypothetical protein